MTKPTFAFVSLGCPKNLVDSERMLGKLAQDGYTLTPDADGADVVVVNTCGFIEPARQESLGVIREMLGLKEQGRVGAVVVAGCLAERKKDDLLQEVPGVDHIVGVFGREEIAQVVDRAVCKQPARRAAQPLPPRPGAGAGGHRPAAHHAAALRLSEDLRRLRSALHVLRHPRMRGKHVTKPIEEVLREARELAADGVRELIVVAQDTTYYGLDLYGQVRLAELLRELDQVDGMEWIRVLYAYPIHFTDELIDTLATAKKIIPYLDMPLQHINDRDAQAHAAAGQPGRDGRSARPAAAGDAGPDAADDVHRRLPRRDGRGVRGAVPTSCGRRGSSGSASSPIRWSRARRPRGCRIIARRGESGAARSADGDPAGNRLRLTPRRRSARSCEAIVDGPDPEVPGHVAGPRPRRRPGHRLRGAAQGQGLRPGDLVRAASPAPTATTWLARGDPSSLKHGRRRRWRIATRSRRDAAHVLEPAQPAHRSAASCWPLVLFVPHRLRAVAVRVWSSSSSPPFTDWLDGYLARRGS